MSLRSSGLRLLRTTFWARVYQVLREARDLVDSLVEEARGAAQASALGGVRAVAADEARALAEVLCSQKKRLSLSFLGDEKCFRWKFTKDFFLANFLHFLAFDGFGSLRDEGLFPLHGLP